jgi:hypothetical protein
MWLKVGTLLKYPLHSILFVFIEVAPFDPIVSEHAPHEFSDGMYLPVTSTTFYFINFFPSDLDPNEPILTSYEQLVKQYVVSRLVFLTICALVSHMNILLRMATLQVLHSMRKSQNFQKEFQIGRTRFCLNFRKR